jgi:hypothetical protein
MRFSVVSLLFLLTLSFSALASEICFSDGHCVRDPSLTASAADSSPEIEQQGIVATQPASSPETAALSAASKCVSPYPRLPLNLQQMSICQQGLQRLAAKEQDRLQKNQEDGKKDSGNSAPPPSAPPAGGGNPQAKKDDDKKKDDDNSGGSDQSAPQSQAADANPREDRIGNSECEKSLAGFVKQCEAERVKANTICDASKNKDALDANAVTEGSGQGLSTTNQRSKYLSGGLASGGLKLSQYGADCSTNHQICKDECNELRDKAKERAQSACKKQKDQESAKRILALIKSKSEQCSSLESVAQAAQNQGRALAQTSDGAAKSQGASAADMSGMMAAMAGLAQRAQGEEDRQKQKASVDPNSLNPCLDQTVMANIPQLCLCAPQGLSEDSCVNMLPAKQSPIAVQTGSRLPASEESTGETRALPAEVSSEITAP